MAVGAIIFVVLSCAILVQESVSSQRCTPVDYPPFLDRHVEFNNEPFQVPHPLRFLIISYHFGCEGTITKWELYTVNNGSHPIEFQVWREDMTISSTVYRLVGKNYFPNAKPDTNNLLSLTVLEDQQIRVQPGDIVGISTIESANPSDDFMIQDYILQGTIVLYMLRGTDPTTPSSLAFQEVNARFSLLHYLPVMNITIVPNTDSIVIPDGGTAPRNNITPGPTALPQSTIIAAASSAALLALLSIVLIITITCCCVMLKREKTKQQKPDTKLKQRSVLLDYNPAYNDRHPAAESLNHHLNFDPHHHDREQQNETYYSLVAEVEVDTSGTCDSYVEIQPSYSNSTNIK